MMMNQLLRLVLLVLATLSVASDPASCTKDVAEAAAHVASATAAIASAVKDCATNETACIADVTKTAGQLAEATDAVTAAVTDCGGSVAPACKGDIEAIASGLSNATDTISKAVTDCGSSKKTRGRRSVAERRMKKNNKLSVYEVNIGPVLGDENQARWAEKAVTIANYHTPSPDTYEAIGKDRLTVTVQAHPSRRVLGQELLDLGQRLDGL